MNDCLSLVNFSEPRLCGRRVNLESVYLKTGRTDCWLFLPIWTHPSRRFGADEILPWTALVAWRSPHVDRRHSPLIGDWRYGPHLRITLTWREFKCISSRSGSRSILLRGCPKVILPLKIGFVSDSESFRQVLLPNSSTSRGSGVLHHSDSSLTVAISCITGWVWFRTLGVSIDF